MLNNKTKVTLKVLFKEYEEIIATAMGLLKNKALARD